MSHSPECQASCSILQTRQRLPHLDIFYLWIEQYWMGRHVRFAELLRRGWRRRLHLSAVSVRRRNNKSHPLPAQLTIWLFPVECGAYGRRVSHECETTSEMWRGPERCRCLINSFEDCFNIRVDICAASHTELVPAVTLWIGNMKHHTDFRWKKLNRLFNMWNY